MKANLYFGLAAAALAITLQAAPAMGGVPKIPGAAPAGSGTTRVGVGWRMALAVVLR
jgi:hypothetical protein